MLIRTLSFIVIVVLLTISCEKEITVDLPQPGDNIVVEGYIENDFPPYVYLTKNSAFFGNFDVNDLSKYFISGAKISVFTDTDTVQLVEYSSELIDLLPVEERKALAQYFGLPLDSNFQLPKISVYTIPFDDDFVGEVGKAYHLKIEVDGKVLTSVTTIPNLVGFQELWTLPHPNPDYDTLVQLIGRVKDPDTLGNYYRYFTRRNSLTYTLNGQSIISDLIGNGVEFNIQIPYGVERFTDWEFNLNTFGYWRKDDTCYVKLSSIDRAHYDFRRTLESELGNQGSPFGGYTRIRSNIKGGIGIWGGYGSVVSVYYPQ